MAMALSMGGMLAKAQDSTAVEEEMDLDFFEMDLEALMQVEVTSVSKKAERLQDVPVSLYVVSSEDIANSGATNLHEVLMLVPGYWGTQSSYSDVNPSMRFSPGANGAIGSMLYLLDGTPLQELLGAGLSWDNFDLPLEDIDRIEVIKGSGGTIYGANSATGVVNIFTKDPEKYGDQVNVKLDVATPGFVSVGVSGGTKIGKLGVAGYAKTRQFNGYGYMDEFSGDSVTVPQNGGGDTTIVNRFDEDFDEIISSSVGLKLSYDISDKTKLSYRNHMNIIKRTEYTSVLTPESFQTQDVLYKNKVSSNRLVSHLRLDHSFNDDHSLFFRFSNNRENDFVGLQGGYEVSNSIYDLELQDNITLGFNSISVGANYRFVNFDIHSYNAPDQIAYIDPQANEFLYGAFVQDKLSFLDGKLNFVLGIKAEQFSLVSDRPYFSPQAKFTFIPVESFTVWGGYSRAYTTPGFNQTNIDLALFKVPAYEFFYSQVAPLAIPAVTQGVYQGAFDQAKDMGADDATAAAQAQAYVDSDAGQQVIATQVDAQVTPLSDPYDGYFNTGVKNGSDTKPTSFDNYEFGLRTSAIKNVLFEANGFYTIIKDAIGASNGTLETAADMVAIESGNADYFYYGNYVEGTSYGLESVIKAIPVKGITLEASYSYVNTELQYQENEDFDISTLSDEDVDQTPDVPSIPLHIIRAKMSFDLPLDFKLSLNGVFTSIYRSEGQYEYSNQRYESILGGDAGVTVAENQERYIVNFKLNKSFAEGGYNVYVFGNDILNTGRIETTNSLNVATLSQTKAMFGFGADINF